MKKMITPKALKRWLALVIIASCSVAHADSIRLGGWSKHFDNNHEYNETHNGFIYERQQYVVGYFYNSFYNDTFTIGRQWKWSVHDDVSFRVTAGVVYGYDYCFFYRSSWCVVAYPEIRMEGWRLQPSVLILGNAAALTLGFSF